MGPKTPRRMISQDISLSVKIASLSPESLALFCMLIPHFSAHGKMLADPHAVKGTVCPLIEWLDVPKIKKCLTEISEKTNVKWWKDEKGLYYLQSLNWCEHQTLREDRLGVDRFPSFQHKNSALDLSLEQLPDNSRSTPGPLPPEVEVEVEVEEEGDNKPPSDALRLSGLLADLIAGNNPSNRSVKPKVRDKSVQRWSVDIDRMLRLDDRALDETEAVIKWCQSDSFWSCNILSGAKLREQYDKLLLQMNRGGDHGYQGGAVTSFAEAGRRMF